MEICRFPSPPLLNVQHPTCRGKWTQTLSCKFSRLFSKPIVHANQWAFVSYCRFPCSRNFSEEPGVIGFQVILILISVSSAVWILNRDGHTGTKCKSRVSLAQEIEITEMA